MTYSSNPLSHLTISSMQPFVTKVENPNSFSCCRFSLSCNYTQSVQCYSFCPLFPLSFLHQFFYYTSVAPTSGTGILESVLLHLTWLDAFLTRRKRRRANVQGRRLHLFLYADIHYEP